MQLAMFNFGEIATTGDSPYTLLDGATRIGIVKQADQLVTARSLWGQSFNGTANVSGNLTGVGNINTSAAPAGTIYTNNWFRSKGSTGWYSEDHGGGWYMSDNTWIRNFGNKDVYLSNKLSVNGNVGIGTTAPSHKLHVSGEIYTTTKVNINGIVLEKDSDGNLKVNGNLYATGGISAYGEGSAGTTGGVLSGRAVWGKVYDGCASGAVRQAGCTAMKTGYARCSTNESKQDIDRQVRELKQAGAEAIFLEYEHGDAAVKCQLSSLLEQAQEGDTIITLEVSRLARSTKQLCEIIEIIRSKHLRLVIVGSITVDCSNGEIDPMTNAFIHFVLPVERFSCQQDTEKRLLTGFVKSL